MIAYALLDVAATDHCVGATNILWNRIKFLNPRQNPPLESLGYPIFGDRCAWMWWRRWWVD